MAVTKLRYQSIMALFIVWRQPTDFDLDVVNIENRNVCRHHQRVVSLEDRPRRDSKRCRHMTALSIFAGTGIVA